MHTPISIIELHGGVRKLYRFPNNYGASDVLSDCLHTIEQIHPLLSFK